MATRTEVLGPPSRPRKQPAGVSGSPALAAKIRGSLALADSCAAAGAAGGGAVGPSSAHGSLGGSGAADKAGDSGSGSGAAAAQGTRVAGQAKHPKGGSGANARHSQRTAMAQLGARIRLQWPSDGRFYGCEIVVRHTQPSGHDQKSGAALLAWHVFGGQAVVVGCDNSCCVPCCARP
jgi:hypothetical protein